MRFAALLLASALPLCAQFVRIEVAFEDTGCASCIESLEGRLGRVRGIERVELDAEHGLVTLHLAADNRVRLTPLLSRITQDGTKITRTVVVARGTITAGAEGHAIEFAGPAQSYALRFDRNVLKGEPQKGVIYKVKASVSRTGAGEVPLLTAESISPDG
ncbi:MAG: hypothetical protein O2968_15120 [Acidobacteria bacterium]|nr:hypothetical protein [Acidobacteriota bacterium]